MALTGYRFGSHWLLPKARELRCGEQLLALPPRAFDCLVYLVERRDRAVGRDELIAGVWERVEVSDAMLAQTVMRIRRVLGDDANAQETVRTVPRFGYRWVAQTEELSVAPATLPGPATSPAPDAPMTEVGPACASRPRAPAMLGGLVFVLALAALLLWFQPREPTTRHSDTPATASAEHRELVLVLPVAVVGADHPSWVRLGAMDALAEQLRRGGLPVAPSSQTIALAEQLGKPGQPPDIGALFEASGAAGVATPWLEAAGGGWRMHLAWHRPGRVAVSYRGEGADVLAATAHTAQALLEDLGMHAAPSPQTGAAGEWQAQAQAAMLAGRLAEAAALLESRPPVLAQDPGLLLQLAQVRSRQGETVAAQALIDRALAAMPPSEHLLHGRAWLRRGGLAARSGDTGAAVNAYRAALSRLPPDAPAELGEAWNGLGVVAMMQGDLREARADLARARALLLRSGDQLAYARTLINQGLLAMLGAHPHESLEHYLLAEPIVLRYGALDESIGLAVSIAFARLYLGQLAAADESAAKALRLSSGSESPATRRQAASIALRLSAWRGRAQAADALYERLAELATEGQFPLAIYAAWRAEVQGDWATLAQAARTALTGAPLEREFRSEATRMLALAARAGHDPALAAAAQVAAEELAASDPAPRWRRALGLVRAQRQWLDGERKAAVATLLALWPDVLEAGMPIERIEIGCALAGMQLALGQREQAASVAEQLVAWQAEDWRVAALAVALGSPDGQARQASVELYRRLAGERAEVPAW